MGKWLAMLKEVAPRLPASLSSPIQNSEGMNILAICRAGGASDRGELIPSQIGNDAADIERAIDRSHRCLTVACYLSPTLDYSPSRSRHFASGTLPFTCGLSLALLRHSRCTHVLRD